MKPYYQENGITIYHGDCRDLLGILIADCCITDPPYGVELIGKRTKRAASLANQGYSDIFVDTPEYVSNVVVPVIRRCIANMARVVVTPGTRNLFAYPPSDDIGCVYNPAGSGLGRWGFNCFTPVLFYGKDPFIQDGLGGRPNSISEVAAGDGDNGHPCPKPLRWMKWLVNRASREGETILDPFMGSGTTLRAAKDLSRKAIGIEIEERYCEIAAKRLSQGVLNLELSQLGNGENKDIFSAGTSADIPW